MRTSTLCFGGEIHLLIKGWISYSKHRSSVQQAQGHDATEPFQDSELLPFTELPDMDYNSLKLEAL